MSESKRLPWGAVALLLVITLAWGGNLGSIKIGAQGMAPLFMAGFRSLAASLLLLGWMQLRKVPLFPDRWCFYHGVVVGLFFGIEFGCIYLGMKHTLASRGYLLLYTQPFFTALGAHFFLTGDRFSGAKISGLVLAFLGVAVLFSDGLGGGILDTWRGDLLLIIGAILWAATTVYLKRFLARRAAPVQTLFYQLAFSAPLLFIMSAFMEPQPIRSLSAPVVVAVFYQCVIIAFLSYLVWFELIHRYPVSLLAGFTFFTPLSGVFVSGALVLGEPITASVFIALTLVTVGMVLVNRPSGGGRLKPAVEEPA